MEQPCGDMEGLGEGVAETCPTNAWIYDLPSIHGLSPGNGGNNGMQVPLGPGGTFDAHRRDTLYS